MTTNPTPSKSLVEQANRAISMVATGMWIPRARTICGNFGHKIVETYIEVKRG